jgi:hypothetical protein
MKLAEKCPKTPSVNCVLEPEPGRAFMVRTTSLCMSRLL